MMIIVHRDLAHFQDICHQETIFMIYGFPGVLFYALVWSGDGTLTATCRVLVNMDWSFRANPASAWDTLDLVSMSADSCKSMAGC
jgi:hypothetical protein